MSLAKQFPSLKSLSNQSKSQEKVHARSHDAGDGEFSSRLFSWGASRKENSSPRNSLQEQSSGDSSKDRLNQVTEASLIRKDSKVAAAVEEMRKSCNIRYGHESVIAEHQWSVVFGWLQTEQDSATGVQAAFRGAMQKRRIEKLEQEKESVRSTVLPPRPPSGPPPGMSKKEFKQVQKRRLSLPDSEVPIDFDRSAIAPKGMLTRMSVGSAFALVASNSSNRSSVRSALTKHQSLPAMLPDAPPPPAGWVGRWPPPPPPLPPPPPEGHVGPWRPPRVGSSEGAPSNVKADAESDLNVTKIESPRKPTPVVEVEEVQLSPEGLDKQLRHEAIASQKRFLELQELLEKRAE